METSSARTIAVLMLCIGVGGIIGIIYWLVAGPGTSSPVAVLLVAPFLLLSMLGWRRLRTS